MSQADDNEPRPPKLLRYFRTEFVAITPGQGKFPKSFLMGGEGGRQVSLKQSFAISKYEVTQNLWQLVMGANPSKWTGPRNSVEMLSLPEANEFCEKTTKLLRAAKLIKADEVVRLPTEAEWEYVARAGTTTAYSFGDDPAGLDEHGWFTGNARGNDPPVGVMWPNPWGLYDVHGYLWEWCSEGVLRGGSWKDGAEKCTSSFRLPTKPATRDDAVGLRCVLASVKK